MIVQNRPQAKSGDTAILESSLYFESSPSCIMNFWYNTFASTGTRINILVKSSLGRLTQLWTKIADNSTNWQSASVSVDAYRNFAFVIEVVFPSGSVGTVTVDDISFSKCAPSKFLAMACLIT